jgi:hypothetical protein
MEKLITLLFKSFQRLSLQFLAAPGSMSPHLVDTQHVTRCTILALSSPLYELRRLPPE